METASLPAKQDRASILCLFLLCLCHLSHCFLRARLHLFGFTSMSHHDTLSTNLRALLSPPFSSPSRRVRYCCTLTSLMVSVPTLPTLLPFLPPVIPSSHSLSKRPLKITSLLSLIRSFFRSDSRQPPTASISSLLRNNLSLACSFVRPELSLLPRSRSNSRLLVLNSPQTPLPHLSPLHSRRWCRFLCTYIRYHLLSNIVPETLKTLTSCCVCIYMVTLLVDIGCIGDFCSHRRQPGRRQHRGKQRRRRGGLVQVLAAISSHMTIL